MRALRPGAVLRLLFVVLLFAGSALVATCRDATVPDTPTPEQAVPLRPRTASDVELTPENSEWERRNVAADSTDCHVRDIGVDSISTNDGLNMISCPSQVVVYPTHEDGAYPLTHARWEMGGWDDTITVTFSRPVGMLAILSVGNHDCYVETYSRVVAYGPDSVELGRTTFRLLPVLCRDVSDPDLQPRLRAVETASPVQKPRVSSLVSVDPSGPFAEAILPIPAGVTRLTIAPPEVWTWRWVNPPPSGYWFGGGDPFYDVTHEAVYHLIFRPTGQVKIAVDSATLKQGDTTVFRVTAPGARQWSVVGYSFVPLASAAESAVRALRGPTAPLRASVPARPSEGARRPQAARLAAQAKPPATKTAKALTDTAVARRRPKAQYLDAAFACSEATAELCYDDPPQTGYEVVTAIVDGVEQRDSVLVTVVPQITVEIVFAGGPNENRSFLAAQPTNSRTRENVITLKARVTPAVYADSVTWEVTAPDTSFVRTVAPTSVPRGASSSFVVPSANISPNGIFWIRDTPRLKHARPGNWPLYHPTNSEEKLAQLDRKAVVYRITAKVTANGQTVRSKPDTVRQDEKDVMREEYIDFGWSLDSIPGRDSLRQQGPPERNKTGDYQYWITGQRLDSLMPVMLDSARARYNNFTPVIMSGYRHPVHHFVHARAESKRSQHLTGNATDWAITRPEHRPPRYTADTWFTELFSLTRDTTVNGCWEPSAAIKKGSIDHRTLDHAHSDWRVMTYVSCPESWRKRD